MGKEKKEKETSHQEPFCLKPWLEKKQNKKQQNVEACQFLQVSSSSTVCSSVGGGEGGMYVWRVMLRGIREGIYSYREGWTGSSEPPWRNMERVVGGRENARLGPFFLPYS